MPILTNIPVTLTADEVLAARRRPGRGIRPALVQAAEEAVALGQTLWQPSAVYDWLDVQAVEGEQVTLTMDARLDSASAVLRLGPKADLLAPARQVLVSVATIGPALERKVRELEAAGEHVLAFLLDSAGVLALGAAGEALHCLVQDAAARQGWGVSPSLSPGSLVGWPVQGQRDLCALLPLDEIGVQLNAHCVLVPHKSASGLVGLGPGYPEHRVGSVCKYCDLAGTCWRRHGEAA